MSPFHFAELIEVFVDVELDFLVGDGGSGSAFAASPSAFLLISTMATAEKPAREARANGALKWPFFHSVRERMGPRMRPAAPQARLMPIAEPTEPGASWVSRTRACSPGRTCRAP